MRIPRRPGSQVAGYDLDSARVWLPEHVRAMSWSDKKRWMDERGLVPVVGGDAAYGSSFVQMLEPFQVADGTTLSTSTTETAITNDSFFTLPPNFFSAPGKQLWIRAMGKVSNIVTTPGTVQFRLRYNGVAGTILANTGAINFRTTASTDNMWYLEAMVEAIATGPSTTALTLLTYGECFLANSAYAVADIANASMPPAGTSLANVGSLDGTSGKALTLTAQFSVSNAGNAITVRNCWILALN